MAPVHGEARSSDGGWMLRDFSGSRVTTTIKEAGGSARTVTTTTAEPVFDFHGGMTGLLLAALPLRAGFEARLPGIGDRDADYTQIRVVRRETVSAGRLGKVSAWMVEIGPRPAASIYWIVKGAPYVVRAVVRGPRAYGSWDMIP